MLPASFAGAFCALLLSACTGVDSAAPDALIPASIFIADPGVVRDGDVVRLRASIRSASGAEIPGATVQWTVTDPSVATVTTSGLLTAMREGTTDIVAVVENGAAGTLVQHRRAVQVYLHPATAIELGFSQLDLPIGVQGGVPVTLRGLNGRVLLNRPLQWSSSDPEVVRVSPAGVITPLKGGVSSVTVRYGTLSGVLQVRVPTPLPDARYYAVSGANGKPLPFTTDDFVQEYPDGSRRRIITRLEGGTVSMSGSYELELNLSWYEATELNGNTILQLFGRSTLTDAGTVDLDAATGNAVLVSTRFGSLTHAWTVSGSAATLTYREPGTDNRWNLTLSIASPVILKRM